MRTKIVLAVVGMGAFTAGAASAQEMPGSINAPPSGAGTEASTSAATGEERVRPGWEGEATVGGGFTDTYGVGFGGRAGYTSSQGIYLGGAGTYYGGSSITTPTGSESAYAVFLGAELGYKIFPKEHWEVRPYVFGGPSMVKSVDQATMTSRREVRFGLQPGVLGAYHFGDVFVSAEARAHLMPTPGAVTLLGGAGLSF